jgi:ribonucleoside-diphosphate reductase alpha chain
VSITLSPFASTVMQQKYLHDGETSWEDVADRVVEAVMGPYLPHLVEKAKIMIRRREFMPGGRYLANTGRPNAQTQNCLLLTVEDNRESIADLYNRVASGLMTGAGVGIVWSNLRPRGSWVRGSGGESTGPCAFMQTVNEIGRGIMQGGSRRAAIWAGLHWNHADVFEFMSLKDWPDYLVEAKSNDFNAAAPMDMTNISIILDDAFFEAYYDIDHADHELAHKVYWTAVEKGLKTGEPGFSIDVGENAGEHLRNACTEVTSADDNDICNLGSLNLARIDSIERLDECVELATAFLLCGTLYSTVPYERVGDTRRMNRRLGLGLMGIYEWLVKRGYRYEKNAELGEWLHVYTKSTGYANLYADLLKVSRPIKTRAIAPTGTIGILAETTTGIEPLFAVAYKRRYLKGDTWHFQYVVDATAQRLIDAGVHPGDLETAYDLANDPDRRLRFQTWVQGYVDQAISSTLNLPAYDEQSFTVEDFGNTLMDHLPKLRGVTMYPDGARGGQPLNVVPYAEASSQVGLEFAEFGNESACVGGVCGI